MKRWPWNKREKTVSEKAEDEDEAEIPGLQRTTSGGQRRPREEERSMWTARGTFTKRRGCSGEVVRLGSLYEWQERKRSV